MREREMSGKGRFSRQYRDAQRPSVVLFRSREGPCRADWGPTWAEASPETLA